MAEKFYIGNIEMIINMAQYFNIPIGLAQQPTLININKNLSSSEKEIFKHRTLALFASDISSFNSEKIPTYEIDKKYFLNLNNFKQGYKSQKNKLENLAKEHQVLFLDLEEALSQYDNIPIFTSIVHFSFAGSKKVSEILFNKLNLDLK